MDKHDLDMDNYDLEDLLNLFQLDYTFGERELKQARKICLRTHPDKSGLPKEYFLFYNKAFHMIEDIYHFRARRKLNSTDYAPEEDEAEKEVVNKIQQNQDQFNIWFNNAFNKVKIKDKSHDDGYEKWFRSDENIVGKKNVALSEFEKEFEKEKKMCKAIVKRKNVEEVSYNSGGYDLVRDRPEEYSSSDIFSKLKYEDLKKAHTETVVPVTRDDFEGRVKFADLESYQRHRAENEIEPMSVSEARRFMAKKAEREGKGNVKRAFKILKQDEEIEKSHKQWCAYIKQLEDK